MGVRTKGTWSNIVHHYEDITARSANDGDYTYLEELAGKPDYNRDRKELYIDFFNRYGIQKEGKIKETCIDHH